MKLATLRAFIFFGQIREDLPLMVRWPVMQGNTGWLTFRHEETRKSSRKIERLVVVPFGKPQKLLAPVTRLIKISTPFLFS